MLAEPEPELFAKLFLSWWMSDVRCVAFLELHDYIDSMITLVKTEASDEEDAQMQRAASELPHVEHWLDKRRLYRESETKG